jgi:hypothetical protein
MVASALWLCAARVRAEASASLETQLEVQPDAGGCISTRAVRARVAHWLKRPPRAGVGVVVHAASQPVSFSVEREGRVVAERSFEHLPAACAERVDAVALAVALAIEQAAENTSEARPSDEAAATAGANAAAASGVQPEASGVAAKTPQASKPQDPGQQSAEPSAKEPLETAPPEAAKPEPARSPRAVNAGERSARDDGAAAATPSRSHPGALRLEAGASYLLGVLPSPTGLISVGIEWLVLPRFELRFAGVLVPASQTAFKGGSALSQVYGARVLACGLVLAGIFGVEGCAGGVGGVARATGEGFDSNPSTTMAWLAAMARAGLRFPAEGAISLRIAADGLANLWRPELSVEGGRKQTASGHAFGAAGSIELLFALP